MKPIPEREMLERRRPHDPVDRLVATTSERYLHERRGLVDLVDGLIKVYFKRQLLERRRPHDHVHCLVEAIAKVSC